MIAPIWIVTGVPGSGKTTVCKRLAKRFDRAIHVEADVFGDWADSGASADPWSHTIDQRRLGQRCAAYVALEYATAGYAAIIDDTLEDENDGAAYAALEPRRIFLVPNLETALARNRTRTNKPIGDAPHLEVICRRLYEPMRHAHTEARGWLLLDTTALDASGAVDAIVARYP